MKKIILFDLDGTLIDSTNAIVNTFYHTFEELNFDFKGNDEDIKNLIGYPLDIMYSKLSIEEGRVWDFVTCYKNRYRKISKIETTLLENATKSIKLASTFARLGVVTTKTGLYSKELLEHFGLMQYFEVLIGREDVENPKPHPEPIHFALKKMNNNLENESIWMIGDTKLDLIAANDAKINSVGVLSGYGKENELKTYTPYIAKDALEAVLLIENTKGLE